MEMQLLPTNARFLAFITPLLAPPAAASRHQINPGKVCKSSKWGGGGVASNIGRVFSPGTADDQL